MNLCDLEIKLLIYVNKKLDLYQTQRQLAEGLKSVIEIFETKQIRARIDAFNSDFVESFASSTYETHFHPRGQENSQHHAMSTLDILHTSDVAIGRFSGPVTEIITRRHGHSASKY